MLIKESGGQRPRGFNGRRHETKREHQTRTRTRATLLIKEPGRQRRLAFNSRRHQTKRDQTRAQSLSPGRPCSVRNEVAEGFGHLPSIVDNVRLKESRWHDTKREHQARTQSRTTLLIKKIKESIRQEQRHCHKDDLAH